MAESTARTKEPRQRLGRGLAALLGEARPNGEATSKLQGVKQVPTEFLRSSVRNPRQTFDETELEELAASIREKGIIQPILVRPLAGAADAYEIVAGERRWRAAQRAGHHTVPVISLQLTDREALELSIVENIQRSDLNALEEARGYSLLASEHGYNQADIGRIVGKSRSYIANTLRLLALPEHTRNLLTSGVLTAGHARALLTVSDPDAMADRVVAEGMTVRDVEKLNAHEKTPAAASGKPDVDPNIKDLENRLSLALGTTVEIHNRKQGQTIFIRLKDLEQMEYVCNKLLAL